MKRKLPPPTHNLEKDAQLYWSSSEKDKTTQVHSHWRGVGGFKEDIWMGIGDFCEELLDKYVGQQDPVFQANISQKTALEWGPGGGANMRILCQKFAQCYGADISDANLKECQKQMESFNYPNFTPILLNAEKPEEILNLFSGQCVDFILSLAVFQHFPSQEYSLRVLKIMHSLLHHNAYALLQIRYGDGQASLSQKKDNYFENVITFTSFEDGEFEQQLEEAGFSILYTEKDRDMGQRVNHYAYYFIRK